MANTGIEYIGYFVLGNAVDFDWEWRRLDAIWNAVGTMRLQEPDMEDRMEETHFVRELQSVCMTGHFLRYAIGTQTLVVKFFRGTLGFYVPSVEPNVITDLKVRGWKSATICGDLVLCLSDAYLVPAVGMKVGKGVGEVVSSRIGDRYIEGESSARIVAIVGEEGGDLRRRMWGVVISKFGDGK
jgi:hypothetical protein